MAALPLAAPASWYLSFYAVFNLVEAAAWWLLSGYFLWKSQRVAMAHSSAGPAAPPDGASADEAHIHNAELYKVCWKSALAAFLFGVSDILEIFLGMIPFTWTIKFGAGLSLFACLMRYDYLKRGPVALAPWRFVAAGIILVVAIYLCAR